MGIGGAERETILLAEAMVKRGHTAALMVLGPRVGRQWQTELPVIFLNASKRPWSLLAAFLRGRRVVREFKPEIIHSHTSYANFAGRLLGALPPRVPVISTVHNIYEGGWLRMMAYRLTDGLARCTTGVSEAVVARYVRMKAVPKTKCVAIANGIDIEEWSPDALRRSRVRAEMGIAEEFVWLAVGRLVEAKDYPSLLRAMAMVHRVRGDARLWIAGEDTEGRAQTIRLMARDLGLSETLRLLGTRRDLPALLDAVDGFVMSSAWEGMPLAIAEAMAMEKPVVATDVGGVRELVGDTGYSIPAKNADALAEAMLAAMRLPKEERLRRCHAGRERIQCGFTLAARANDWEALYRRFVTEEKMGRRKTSLRPFGDPCSGSECENCLHKDPSGGGTSAENSPREA